MITKTLKRIHIVESLMREMHGSRPQATKFLEATLELIVRALVDEGEIKLSSFGSFHVRQKSKRMGRNPKTKEEAIITPRKTLSFRPSQYLKDKVYAQKSGQRKG